MRLFRSEEHAARWRAFRDLPPCGTMTPEQCWRVAKAWYAEKLRPDWRRKSLDEAEATLAGIGLTGPFRNLRA